MADPYLDAPFGLVPQQAPRPLPSVLPQYNVGVRLPQPPPITPSFVNDANMLRGIPGPMRRQMQIAMPQRPIPQQAPREQPPIRPVASIGAAPVVGKDVKPEDITKYIRQIESSNNYQALNPTSSASGAYQYIDSTWNNFGGYPRAALAPKQVQDTKFMLDLNKRLERYNNDPYKVIAAHYLPALADTPERWTEPFRIGKHNISPVEQYVRKVIAGTPLEDSFDAYLTAHTGRS